MLTFLVLCIRQVFPTQAATRYIAQGEITVVMAPRQEGIANSNAFATLLRSKSTTESRGNTALKVPTRRRKNRRTKRGHWYLLGGQECLCVPGWSWTCWF